MFINEFIKDNITCLLHLFCFVFQQGWIPQVAVDQGIAMSLFDFLNNCLVKVNEVKAQQNTEEVKS